MAVNKVTGNSEIATSDELARGECHTGIPIAKASEDWLSSCVHCGFCLESCPTYRLTGDENNSPRGRLRLWRQEAEGRLPIDAWTQFYTSECVGCMACETACPANVPYAKILEQVRQQQLRDKRSRVPWKLRIASALVTRPALLNHLMAPVRLARRLNLLRHRFLFTGCPAVGQSTQQYARDLVDKHRPTGPRVALLTGCLMESVFREINFATVRVLVENNIAVFVPTGQSCCGAFQEHLGYPDDHALRASNRQAFEQLDVEAVISNSSGCGLALKKSLSDAVRVCDLTTYLGEREIVSRVRPKNDSTRVYVDLPCHLIHGQRVSEIPAKVLDATGYRWELALHARDCCGSGGTYNLQKPENSRQILARKSSFLDQAEGAPVVLATSNHVCMMQWYSAGSTGLVKRSFDVRHIAQLLDPGDQF